MKEAVEELRHATDPHGRALFACAGRVVLDPPLARPPVRRDRRRLGAAAARGTAAGPGR
ncbi:hypothetical protein LV779_15180 [Streptomyces thinghirensis]|nr:hypothetical protein [Streptomyces thinghirensis]